MAGSPSPDEVDRLVEELIDLSEGPGFTRPKARRASGLNSLGFRLGNATSADLAQTEGLRTAIEAAIKRLEETNLKLSRRKISAAFIAATSLGLGDYRGPSLLIRRDSAARAQYGAAGSTMATHERAALTEIAVILLQYQHEPQLLDGKLKQAIRQIESSRGASREYVRVTQKTEYYLDEDGRITELITNATVRSMREALADLLVWTEHFEDHTPGIIVTRRPKNVAISRQADANGAHFTEFQFDPPLRHSEERTIGYAYAVSSELRSAPRMRVTGVEAVDDRASHMAIQFTAPMVPDLAWWFVQEGIGAEFAPVSGQELAISSSGYVEHEFKELRFGLNYGIGWMWPSDEL